MKVDAKMRRSRATDESGCSIREAVPARRDTQPHGWEFPSYALTDLDPDGLLGRLNWATRLFLAAVSNDDLERLGEALARACMKVVAKIGWLRVRLEGGVGPVAVVLHLKAFAVPRDLDGQFVGLHDGEGSYRRKDRKVDVTDVYLRSDRLWESTGD